LVAAFVCCPSALIDMNKNQAIVMAGLIALQRLFPAGQQVGNPSCSRSQRWSSVIAKQIRNKWWMACPFDMHQQFQNNFVFGPAAAMRSYILECLIH
jgi:hypothetical protein